MDTKLIYLNTIAFILFIFSGCKGQDFKGIVPMKSTCQDVKKLFPEADCTKIKNIFKTKEEEIEIKYTSQKCQRAFGQNWDVPIGTVIYIERHFFRHIKKYTLAGLGIVIDEKDYYKGYPDLENQVIYDRKNGGFGFSLTNGLVDGISYTVTEEDVKTKGCKTKQVLKPQKKRSRRK
jgi:hypothetical protein